MLAKQLVLSIKEKFTAKLQVMACDIYSMAPYTIEKCSTTSIYIYRGVIANDPSLSQKR